MSTDQNSQFLDKVWSVLEPMDPVTRRVALNEMIEAASAGRHPADRIELLARLHGLLPPDQEITTPLSLDAALEACGLLPFVEAFEQRAKQLILPAPTTASNTETLLMSYGYWFSPLDEESEERFTCALLAAGFRSKTVERARKNLMVFVETQFKGPLLTFACGWCAAAFARLEIGHKLAASLCLTDIPDDIDVRAPWEQWSLVVPDGLLGSLARVWCVGSTPRFGVLRDGSFFSYAERDAAHAEADGMLRALVRGACLALSNPDDFRKERQHTPSARAQHKSRRHGPPDMQQARFLLSAPVKIDLREQVTSALTGKGHASPTVQFLVRGHWRNQAHGRQHSLRKTIWVQPFWKGDPDTRILLRQHRVEEPPKEPT